LERFFILGCQRSGTTLLRLILESHPDIFCYDEIKGYAVLEENLVEDLAPTRLVGFKLPRWTEQFTRAVLSDEGAEGACPNFYRGEKILFLRRDVRDNIASMLKLKAGNASWCELWVPRLIRAKVAADPAFRLRYAKELAIIDDCESPLIGLAALYWKYKNDAFTDYRRAGFPVLPVLYESLVTDPRPVLESICAHLGIPFHENLMRHNELPHTELFESGLTVGNTDPRQPIQPGSIQQWTRFLSDPELGLIDRILKLSAPPSRPASAGALGIDTADAAIVKNSANISLSYHHPRP
jgi:hypothetical protein